MLSEQKCQEFCALTYDTCPLTASLFASSASAPDSDDDNLPIAQFAKKHKKSAAPVDSDSEDDTLLTDLMKVRAQNLHEGAGVIDASSLARARLSDERTFVGSSNRASFIFSLRPRCQLRVEYFAIFS